MNPPAGHRDRQGLLGGPPPSEQAAGVAAAALTIPLELFIPFMLIFVTNLTVGAVSGYLGPHSNFRLYILFS